MCIWAGDHRCGWLRLVVASSAAALTLHLAVRIVDVPPEWAAVVRCLVFLPPGLVACRFGRRAAWVVAAAGALSFLLPSLVGTLVVEGSLPYSVERLFAGGLLFPVALLAAQEGGQDGLGEASPQRPSSEPAELDRVGDTIQDKPDLKTTLDAILSSTFQLVPYDIAEITLWA